MTKSIFVIDTPSICADCPRFPICSLEYALLHGKELKAVGKPIKKICKLKPMPEKKPLSQDRGKNHCEYSLLDRLEYQKGFNDCLDEIIGADTTRDCKTCGHSNEGKCAGTEECHDCMWVNNYIEADTGD